MLHRPELRAGVVLGDPHHEAGEDEADHGRRPQLPHRDELAPARDVERHARQHLAHDPLGDRIERDERQDPRHPQAAIERGHHVLVARLRLHEPGADDGGDDREAADHERVDDRRGGGGLHHQRAEQHGRDQRHRVGLEQVGRHPGAVADVVADVVRDHRRIARIVLGDAGLDLADEVGADVGTLGEDAAPEPREDRDQRPAEAEPDERLERLDQRLAALPGRLQQPEVAGNAEQPEAHHQQAGDRAAAKRHRERLVQPLARGLGGAHVGAHRHVHADDPGQPGQDRPDREAPGGRPPQAGHEPDHDEEHQADDRDRVVLAPEIGDRALAHRPGDLAHARIALGLAQDPADRVEAVDDREDRAAEREQKCGVHRFPLIATGDLRSVRDARASPAARARVLERRGL